MHIEPSSAALLGTDPHEIDSTPLGELLALASTDEHAVLVRATAWAAALLGECAACVLVDGDAARIVVSTDARWQERPIDLTRYPEVRAALAGELVVVEDTLVDPRLEAVRALLPLEARSLVALPLDAGHGPLGVLMARSSVPRRPHPRALATAAATARMAAVLVERFRLGGCARAAIDRAGDAPATELPTVGVASRRRVLIVEDDPSHVQIVAAVLKHRSLAVESAPNGARAIERAHTGRFDLILLDVRIPAVDGFSVAAALRSDARTRDVPILFLSACDEVAARVRALSLGAVDYLAKPFHGAELLARVDRTLATADAREQLRAQAHEDPLTGLGNLRFLQERLAEECARAARYRLPLTVAMLDVDGLKQVNDGLGHAAGNALLERVGRVLRAEVRESDAAARYGGDEFVVLLPHTTLEEGQRFGARVRRRLRDEYGDGRGAGATPICVSIGLATLDPERPAMGDELLAAADGALYRAKREGGDRLCVQRDDEAARPEAAPLKT